MPWYVRWVIGTGAWVTAVVLIALGAAFVFALLDIQNRAALAVFGAVLYGYGLWLLWHGASGIFAQQLGIATAAAGAAMIAAGQMADDLEPRGMSERAEGLGGEAAGIGRGGFLRTGQDCLPV